jgi:hypothetical protein
MNRRPSRPRSRSASHFPVVLEQRLNGGAVGPAKMSGVSLLLSYVHYRFRGPDPMLLRGTFEYFLGKFPAAASNGSHHGCR